MVMGDLGASTVFFLRSTARPLSKPLRRWRAAFAVVCSCRALAATVAQRALNEALRRTASYVALDVGAAASGFSTRSTTNIGSPNKSARSWRKAFHVIYSCRAFVTLTRRRVAEILSRRPSYVALDVQVSDQEGTVATAALERKLSLVNQGRLVEVVGGKNLDGLRELGGMEGIAASLATDVEKGIVGDGDVMQPVLAAHGGRGRTQGETRERTERIRNSQKTGFQSLAIICFFTIEGDVYL